MNLKPFAALSLPLLCVSMSFAQITAIAPISAATSTATVTVGAPAPALEFNHLLQAPDGAKADWPSLRGKVVVLEFWATWCAPCIAEIPLLNALQASLDPANVQFISVDDEDPVVVNAFLKKKPILGWIGIDTSSKVFDRYGMSGRPGTVVIGPDGRIVSLSLRPEQLKRNELLTLAKGEAVTLSTTVDPKIEADLNASVEKEFANQIGGSATSTDSLFELRITAAKPLVEGQEAQTHILMLGPGKMDILDAPADTLLENGAGIQKTRMTVKGVLPKLALYNLNVYAPLADRKILNAAIETAIASAVGLTIEHKTADTDALVLTALPDSTVEPAKNTQGGYAYFDTKTQTLKCVDATINQIGRALETVAGKPVVNESELKGTLSASIAMPSKDLAAVNEAIARALGVTLKPAVRPIETVVVTVIPPAAAVAPEEKDVTPKP